jgi:anti-sigma factor RsiW
MTDQWTDRLSDYLDGELLTGERTALEQHLLGCPACRATLAELRRVVARAQALDDTPPAADLWPAIARRIGGGAVSGRADVPDVPGVINLAERRARRRISFTVPQLAAAGIALMLVSGGVVWNALSRGAAPVAVTPAPPAIAPAPDGALAAWTGDASYDLVIARLEQLLEQNRTALDTATVRVLEKNLEIIDRAIAEARAALAADPASAYLNHHLARTMRRKVDLLRQASALAGAGTT